MKRELKGRAVRLILVSRGEAEFVPMKRELKERPARRIASRTRGSRVRPYEEGTESLTTLLITVEGL